MAQIKIQILPDHDSEVCFTDFHHMNIGGIIKALRLLLGLTLSGKKARYLEVSYNNQTRTLIDNSQDKSKSTQLQSKPKQTQNIPKQTQRKYKQVRSKPAQSLNGSSQSQKNTSSTYTSTHPSLKDGGNLSSKSRTTDHD